MKRDKREKCRLCGQIVCDFCDNVARYRIETEGEI